MALDGTLGQLGRPLQILIVDLMLAGDNALMVALVCRSLPPQYQHGAMFLGTTGAVALRFLMSAAAITLLALPAVKLVGAALLVIIALNLVRPALETEEPIEGPPPIASLLAAGILLAIVDFIMSLDNIVALAAVAQGSVLYLGLGLLLSIPFLFFGNVVMLSLLRRHRRLVASGGAVLGWVAGGMAVSDPLLTGWVADQAPALVTVIPALTAVYVLAMGWAAPGAPIEEPATARVAALRANAPSSTGGAARRLGRRDLALFLILFAIASGMLIAALILSGVFHG
jgi:YjbE family integral membrane protein